MSLSEVSSEAGAASAVSEKGASSWARIVNEIFGQHLLHVSLLVGFTFVLGSAMLQPKEFVSDSDLWWHLADARILTSTHHFIRIEPYSFSVAGARWVDPEWLSEMPYWAAYSLLGLRGIHLAALLGLCFNLVFVYLRGCWKSGNRKASFWTAILAFFLMTINSGARTIVFAYLAMSAEMAIIECTDRGRRQLLWLLPPLFCLWINLHGSWIIGMGFLCLYFICGLFDIDKGAFKQPRFSTSDRNRVIGVLMASVAALFVNPYGWRLIWNPFDMLVNQKVTISIMQEWQPLNLGSSAGIAAACAIGVMLLANLICPRRWRLYEAAFVFCAWYYAFAHQRFAYLACVVTIPLLAADIARAFYDEPSSKTIPVLNAVFAVGVIGWLIYSFPSEAVLQKELAAGMPLQSIAATQPSWRTFNAYSLGGMFAFRLRPEFLDSRNDTFEHHGILQQFLAIESLNHPLKRLDDNRIDHALIHANSPLAFVLEHSKDWRILMREGEQNDAYELFERITGIAGH